MRAIRCEIGNAEIVWKQRIISLTRLVATSDAELHSPKGKTNGCRVFVCVAFGVPRNFAPLLFAERLGAPAVVGPWSCVNRNRNVVFFATTNYAQLFTARAALHCRHWASLSMATSKSLPFDFEWKRSTLSGLRRADCGTLTNNFCVAHPVSTRALFSVTLEAPHRATQRSELAAQQHPGYWNSGLGSSAVRKDTVAWN